MKFRSLFVAALSALAITAGFTSCSDDEWSWKDEGSNVEMANTRAFVLNEGSFGSNNAGLTYFNWKTDDVFETDLFVTQNKVQMGDTGQDLIVAGGKLYLVVSGSGYVAKLNSVGVEEARWTSTLGDPRYAVEEDGYLYVTCYSGCVARINTKDMTLAGSVEVGANPEYIIEKDGVLYCTCSGWGYDKRVAAINIKSFNKADYITVMDNPDRIIEVNDRIFVQGYGPYYDYPWGEIKNGTYTELGNATSWTSYGDVIYLAYSATDWTTYVTSTTFSSYDTKTSKLTTTSFLKNAPAELASSSVYGMSTNKYTGEIYIMTSDYVSNGTVYHFQKDGTYVGKFTTTGISPRKIVFLK